MRLRALCVALLLAIGLVLPAAAKTHKSKKYKPARHSKTYKARKVKTRKIKHRVNMQ